MSVQEGYPPSFVCPLTMEIMEDPVMDHCAHNFERSAVVKWLSEGGHSCCPISRKPLSLADLVPNHALAERIERWKWHKEQSGIELSHSFSSDTVGTATESDGMVDVDVGDIEHGGRRLKRFLKKKRKRAVQYDPVPAGLILLPQERLALQLARNKAVEQDNRQWRERCLRFLIASIIVALSASLIMFGVSRVMKEPDDEMR